MLRLLAMILLGLCATRLAESAPPPGAAGGSKRLSDEKKTPPVSPALETHKVKRGETLWGVARLHGVSVGDIMDLNHLTEATLAEGQMLKIPPAGKDAALARTRATSHTIAKGETFRSIARRYGLTREELEQANPRIDPDQPKAGARLVIPATALPGKSRDTDAAPSGSPAADGASFHTVSEGETYHSIAKKRGVSIAALAAANPDAVPERLRPGMKLRLPERAEAPRSTPAGPGDTSPEEIPADASPTLPSEEKPAPKTRRYVVSAEETPQTISEAFEISVSQLYQMNGLKPGTPLKAGMEIQVPLMPGGIP